MNDRSRMMLYALTAVACVMWIWQSVKESMNDGTIISTSNIIFLVCIGIAAIYCAANALILWWRQPGKDDAADDDETDSRRPRAVPRSFAFPPRRTPPAGRRKSLARTGMTRPGYARCSARAETGAALSALVSYAL